MDIVSSEINHKMENGEQDGSRFNLHLLEEKLMASPLKKLMFKYFEFKIFKRLIRPLHLNLTGKRFLECGCGAGYGIEVLYNNFLPEEYYAFDIDEKMVLRSFSRVKNSRLPVTVFRGDIKEIPFPKNRFDCVFNFTVLHHEPLWREALKEIHRVLRPDGILILNEINDRSLNWFERYIKIHHPKAARFTWEVFRKELKKAGFTILNEHLFLQDFGFFICKKSV